MVGQNSLLKIAKGFIGFDYVTFWFSFDLQFCFAKFSSSFRPPEDVFFRNLPELFSRDMIVSLCELPSHYGHMLLTSHEHAQDVQGGCLS